MSDSFKFQTAADPGDLARCLTSLAEGLKSGVLAVAEGEVKFSVHPRGLADLTIKVHREKGRVRVGLEISWFEAPSEPPFPADGGGRS
jgi:amphi-Trp domain-containing protein